MPALSTWWRRPGAVWLVLVALAAGAPAAFAGTPSDAACFVRRTPGGIDAATRADGETLLAVTGPPSLLLLRSRLDGGYDEAALGVDGRWPSLVVDGAEVFLAAGLLADSTAGTPSRIFVLRSVDGGFTWGAAVDVHTSTERLRDPELVQLADGSLVLVFVEESPTLNGRIDRMRAARSQDGGATWQALPAIADGPPGVAIEDPKAVTLLGGDLLLAYEVELEDLGASRLEQRRSRDGGQSWERPTVLWDDVPGSDDEPGGYQWVPSPGGDPELWFLASTDEDVLLTDAAAAPPGGSLKKYATAVVKRKISTDLGATWEAKATLVDIPDQIVFGSGFDLASGRLVVATVRFFSTPPRELYVYSIDPHQPGVFACSSTIFADGFESGDIDAWSSRARGIFEQFPSPCPKLKPHGLSIGHGKKTSFHSVRRRIGRGHHPHHPGSCPPAPELSAQ